MAGYIGSKASVVSSGAEHKKVFNITTTTTSLTGLVYTPTLVHVFHNGVRLVDGTDYTATNGTSITLTVAAENGDQVAVVSYATFQVADAYTKVEADGRYVNTTGDTLTGNLTGTTATFSGAVTGTDLTLSGGVYLGGTGSANYLDDYEEGTSSGTLFPNSGGSFTTATYTGRYRKISSLVHFSFEATITTLGSGNTGFLVVLPFTADGSFGYSGTGRRMTDNVQFHTVVDGTTYLLARNTAAGGTLEAGSTTYKGMIIYHST